MSGNSLTSLMSAMINRLEFTQPEEMATIPEDKYWHMIQLYIAVDPLLAHLYKQYCDTKDNLGRLVISHGSEDPMTEIVWDMHDSARAAVETRLIELKNDKTATDRAQQLASLRVIPKTEYTGSAPSSPAQELDEAILFMLMASMAMKANARRPDKDFARRDFVRAC